MEMLAVSCKGYMMSLRTYSIGCLHETVSARSSTRALFQSLTKHNPSRCFLEHVWQKRVREELRDLLRHKASAYRRPRAIERWNTVAGSSSIQLPEIEIIPAVLSWDTSARRDRIVARDAIQSYPRLRRRIVDARVETSADFTW
jgi:hypothetical protein